MNRIGVLGMFCLVLVACSEDKPESKTYPIVAEANSKNTEGRKIRATVKTTQVDWKGEEKQPKDKAKKVRFVPPQVVHVDPEPFVYREPIDPSPYQIGPVEPVEELWTEKPQQDEILQWAEEMPDFPGGMKALMEYIKANLKYPASSKEAGLQGNVYIGFVVFKDGTHGNYKIRRGFDEACDKEAMRVIKAMPKWKPGKQNGKTVNCEMTVPIKFRLEG